ncbi:hypothetical protein Ae406Ps2_5300 [Pseudonocardia sp. Ae406_Ps2]|nr:hypothetical protein Ae331Ps2_0657c [Pseudonocardia sp. Ae331_Ps2]OLM05300.1 hypothetical protein Ae406Ps2_5300 [Pseudonocardia sp. Ae406_Ps2]OLM09889.1 hypothetical protein Ae505Ps2_0009 [Pseudonocardia sp. Ae505_Ps2]OLM26870.1 hypothetical protein Ae706Ps2_5304 [Pseudonocardia sp. Ae706_Ps2]OLM26872.1 hypothetical protein Ae706Ps2_5306 [Pseudonocardia sp. Ae706_Ps2]
MLVGVLDTGPELGVQQVEGITLAVERHVTVDVHRLGRAVADDPRVRLGDRPEAGRQPPERLCGHGLRSAVRRHSAVRVDIVGTELPTALPRGRRPAPSTVAGGRTGSCRTTRARSRDLLHEPRGGDGQGPPVTRR